MEFLGFHILESCESGNWKPIKVGQSGHKFSDLFFADDLVLFSSATISAAHAIDEVLGKFCNASGQKVSLTKSRVLFSPNVSSPICQDIVKILNIRETTNLGKYLGIPISASAVRARDFDYLIDKVSSKLSSWKSRLLSLLGRTLLIQSVIEAIPAYVMQCTALPLKVCDTLDGLNRNFLWGSTAEKRKLYLVSWRKVTQPKKLGGLGLHLARARNTAAMAKLVWRAYKRENDLWVIILRNKYLKKILGSVYKKCLGSRTWGELKKGWPLFLRGSCWAIHNGLSTSPWHDNWMGSNSLRNLLVGPLSSSEDKLMRAWEFFLIVGPSTTSRASVPIWVRWTPPIPGWIKLNTDGSSNGNPGLAGGGGVICDHEGNWLRGFARHIGLASSVVAELWALRDGLSLVIDMDFLNCAY
uniref:RNase H type-1 domain-containing protein n=1 Tax=Fagus sylvatica TaxID=28930 RepID=A0A2N9IHR9_FAGSY